MSAAGSSDPDGHSIDHEWSVYAEAGTYPGEVALNEAHSAECGLLVPADAAGTTIHAILTIRDDGTPPLAAYRRAIVRVREAE